MASLVVDEESPKELIPEVVQGIDHEIELLLGARPPAKNAYHTGPTELVELVEFLDVGFIRRAKGLLTELLKKDHKWEWTPESQAAFGDLKKAMMEGSVLGIADDAERRSRRERNACNGTLSESLETRFLGIPVCSQDGQ
ncbi:RNA-directed DNA polymerase-like protein [Cucumis melo var. makuwa]|uniref:RNA-directed DNA polymerase-like protein n=1 Tax=Cucumis melo var. makuwa TaxID=1194695 RepID=A0A5A7VI34_CUCMM|nr:RNA-directed DNA polymerase-like protein [Cucumis melo var. makuwa]TYK28008.1 RNA-directed DNA polymerase-like protein [Cucumis melo var. makuwa]